MPDAGTIVFACVPPGSKELPQSLEEKADHRNSPKSERGVYGPLVLTATGQLPRHQPEFRSSIEREGNQPLSCDGASASEASRLSSCGSVFWEREAYLPTTAASKLSRRSYRSGSPSAATP